MEATLGSTIAPRAPREPAHGPSFPTPWLRVLLLGLALALGYANSLRVPFLFDDPFVLDLPGQELDYSTRPLVWATFDLNRALTARATWSYHVFNALVHFACGCLLLGVLRRIAARAVPALAARTRDDLAFVTTLLWLCHPLQTAAVTYLSQRAETLAALFYLLVLYAFLRSTSGARPRVWQALALVALALGFAAKETIATAPLALWLLDGLFLAPGLLGALRLRPWFYGAMALVTLALFAYLIAPLLGAPSAGFELQEFGPLAYARTQPGVLLHYLRLAVWPHPLCFDYGWPIAEEARDYVPQGLVVVALLGASAALALRRQWLGFAGLFFFLFLAPTSSFVPILDPAFEHRVYLPLAVPVLLLVVAGRWMLARLAGPAARRLAPALVAVLALGLTALTVRRNRDYRSAVTLMQLTVESAPRNARAHASLGAALMGEDRTEEAIPELLAALGHDIRDGYVSDTITPGVYQKLGLAYTRLQQHERALPFLERAAALTGNAGDVVFLGDVLAFLGQGERAAAEYERALALRPEDASLHAKLGKVLAGLGRAEEARAQFLEALRLEPEEEAAHLGLSEILAAQGEAGAALEHARHALAVEPNTVSEYFGVGRLFGTLGRYAEAADALREAIRRGPEAPAPYAAFARAVCLREDATRAEREEALQAATRAIEVTGATHAGFLEVGALAHAALEEFERAAARLDQALALPETIADPLLTARLRAQRDDYRRRAGH
jgi:tetratricopeptide (TPR) repeat protein